MTSRLLLTLLALLTGLAAQASAGEARMPAASSAQMSALTARAGEVASSIPAGAVRLPAGIGRGRLALERQEPSPAGAVFVSAVLTGIDRARE